MSWLIESYLEEGKHGPDHPESLNMQDKTSFEIKKRNEESDKDMDDLETISRFKRNCEAKDKKGKIFNNVVLPERKEALKKTLSATKKSKKQGNKLSTINKVRAMDATERHERRHPDKKAVNASAWIVESLQ